MMELKEVGQLDFFFYGGMIKIEDQKDELLESLEPVIKGLGFDLADLTHIKTRNALQVHCVIYSKNGISLNDCALVHKTVLPRIELLENTKDVNLQVSSPGTDRKIKKAREFVIFRGRSIKLFRGEEWIDAIIDDCDDKGVCFLINGNEEYVLFSEIIKAKLT